MQFAVWAYPWDILDEGPQSVAEELAQLGIDEVNLATSYHSVQAFLPHNPKRRTFFARASTYFQPDDSQYGQVKPVPNGTMGDADWVGEIASALSDVDLKLNSWTVGCHNSRIGMTYPDLTLESPFGDSLVFGLCPSQPAVQQYLTGLLDDLSARGIFQRIELETFDYFHGSGFGWHHDKFHVDLGSLGEFLFGLCFCDACRSIATEAGINVKEARNEAREGIQAIIEGRSDGNQRAKDWIRRRPSLADYVDMRTKTLEELYEDLYDTVGNADLGRYTGFFSVESAWMHGADLESLSKYLDYSTVVAYESDRESVLSPVRAAERVTSGIPVHAGLLPGHPALESRESLQHIVDGLAEAGTERVSFYNYGLLPEKNLRWIGETIDEYT